MTPSLRSQGDGKPLPQSVPSASLARHIADVLDEELNDPETTNDLVNALLADPTLAEIIDLAAVGLSNHNSYTDRLSPEVRALLADWRESR